MKKIQTKNFLILAPIAILILGIILRILFTGYFGIRQTYNDFWGTTTYTHDGPDHMQYIKFVAENLSLPEIDKAIEYPQQPLYYIITGLSYRLLKNFSGSSDQIFRILIWYSCLFSILSLILVFLISKKVTQSVWLQSFITGIFAFTPAFIFHSIMISNDPMLCFLSAASFYFLLRYSKSERKTDIILSIVFASLTALTKISAGFIFFIIIGFLIYKFKKQNNAQIFKIVFAAFLIGFLCFGTALWRAYIPSTNQFRFVESYSWSNQRVYPDSFSYLFSFNLTDLLKEAQSHVFGNAKIAKTLPTFLYGSFIFGEYNYHNITDLFPYIKFLMQIIIIFGLLFPIGLLFNLFFIKKWDAIDYICFSSIIINLVLLLSFLFKYSAVCNSDFRYFNPVFSGLIIFSGMGLFRVYNKMNNFKFIIPTLCILLISFEFLWVAARIIIKATTNI